MPDNQKKIRFGVVGCGAIGSRHIAVISNENRAELRGICDIDPAKLSKASETAPNARAYANLKDLLNDASIDVVCVCTPHASHAEISIAAANAKKHVLVEKPMSLSTKDAKRIIAAAKKNGVKLWVVKQNRFNAPIVLLRKALEEKRLGKILKVNTSVLWNRNQEYYADSDWRGKKKTEGGVLYTQVSHFIDLLLWFFGPIKESPAIIATKNHKIEIEDIGTATLKFSSGALGLLDWTTCVYRKNLEGSITVFGEKGTVKIGGQYLNKIELWDVESFPLPQDATFEDAPNSYGGKYQGTSSNHGKVIAALVSILLGEGGELASGEEGLESVALIEKIYAKAKKWK